MDIVIGSNGVQIPSLRWSGEEQSDHRRASILGKLNSCSLHRQSGSYFQFPLLLGFYRLRSMGWGIFSFKYQVAESEPPIGLKEALSPTLLIELWIEKFWKAISKWFYTDLKYLYALTESFYLSKFIPRT